MEKFKEITCNRVVRLSVRFSARDTLQNYIDNTLPDGAPYQITDQKISSKVKFQRD